jgi:hypothetical protein
MEPYRDSTSPPQDIRIEDDMVLRAARMLRYLGWDTVRQGDMAVEPSDNLQSAARAALKAALHGIPVNDYVTNGPSSLPGP